MNAEVIPYHWDDRNKLYSDYQYLNIIYENMLKALTNQLNEIHSVDHSLRYWRILIGPWLAYFIQMVFDRWSMLNSAFKSYDINCCKILLTVDNTFIPKDHDEFNNMCIDDNWNEMIYGQLLKEYRKDHIDFEYITIKNDQVENTYRDNGLIRSSLSSLKQSLLSAINKYKYWMNSSDDYFLIKTYLPSAIEDELLLRLGQKPKLWETPQIPKIEANMGMRKWIIDKYSEFDEFLNVIGRMIPFHIPTAYLEGYNSLVNLIENLTWPKKPKCIFASNGIQTLDLLKAWAAQKTENGTALIIGQHGGHYGIGLWSFEEDHEISISDRYLSWGWSDPDQPKVYPVGQIKNVRPLGINHAEQSKLLLVTNVDSRYSYRMYSYTVSSQWLEYLEDQFIFTENLSPMILNEMTVRLYPTDYRWCQEKRWSDRFPNLTLDVGRKNINELITKSRVFVSTCNGATYLETFTMDIPTVIFWNPKHWEIRNAAIPYFDELKQVGIFHETPESAAIHVSEVWDDIYSWWKSKPVRNALDQFKSQYCNIDCNLAGNIEAELRAEFNKS
jgi:putative transferase (TIGR04331 family)